MDDPTCQWTDPRTGHICGAYADIQLPKPTRASRKPTVLCAEHLAAKERRLAR